MKNYDRINIMKKCELIENIQEQITYLKKVKHEYVTNRPEIDENNFMTPSLEDYLDEQIKYREDSLRNNSAPKLKEEYELKDLIWWKGSEPMLIFLFDLLSRANLIDDTQFDKRFSLMAKHFKNKNGDRFDNKQLARVFERTRPDGSFKKPQKKDAEKIEDILKEIRNNYNELK